MQNITGIGGFFFRSKDPKGLKEWNSMPEVGAFARIQDPEGNATELWEPAKK